MFQSSDTLFDYIWDMHSLQIFELEFPLPKQNPIDYFYLGFIKPNSTLTGSNKPIMDFPTSFYVRLF